METCDKQKTSSVESDVTAKSETTKESSPRLRSLDALRGFDMFWIVGGSTLAVHFAKYTEWNWVKWFAGQMHHPGWKGFTLYDLIFPLFLFLAGVAIPYSLGRKMTSGVPRHILLRKIVLRAATLVLLGAIYNGDLLAWKTLSQIRICSVLGYIGLAYLFAGLLYLYADLRHQIIWAVGILLGYWAALMWIHVPGHGAGVLTPEGCITAYLDRSLLPWKFNMVKQMYDSQGIFVTIPAIVTCLLGCFTGAFLQKSKLSKCCNVLILLGAAAVCFGLGFLWETQLFISKELWNPPFVLRCAGYSLALLGVFYGIIDALGFWRWSFFFIVIGMNPITIYLGSRIINFHQPKNFIFGGLFHKIQNPELQAVWGAIAFIMTWWLLLLFLYRKKIFLKV